jgi:type II secretory pathway component PulJ
MTRPGPDSGFLLLETLIAFVIAALALVVLFRAAFDGVAATAIARHEAEALDRAQSRLAALRAMAPSHRYVRAGRDGAGFRYRESAIRLAAKRSAALVPVRLTVTESWGPAERSTGQRGVTLTTIIAAMP